MERDVVQTLHVAYTGGSRAYPAHIPDKFPEGDERPAGQSPMDVIREISESGSLLGRPIRGAYVLEIDTHGDGQERLAAVWGDVPIAVAKRETTQTADLGGRNERRRNPSPAYATAPGRGGSAGGRVYLPSRHAKLPRK